jgi:hypothetical protein
MSINKYILKIGILFYLLNFKLHIHKEFIKDTGK